MFYLKKSRKKLNRMKLIFDLKTLKCPNTPMEMTSC